MSSNYNIELPEIFPLDEITVEGERHQYKVYEGDSGPIPEDEYTLDKAPITKIKKVVGKVDGEEGEFKEGVDYTLSADSERIVWLNGDRPDPGSYFRVTYLTDSIIGRYVESGDEELEEIENALTSAIESKFISTAEGEELDRIGKLFGPVIGKRRGRTDEQYRIYLESVVQSFVSRGTKTGIKVAISAATDVPVEDITIKEDFENNEYEVIVIPDTPVDVSLLEEIAEIADPSGVRQRLTRFPISDQMGAADSATFSEGQNIPEDMGVSDSTASPRRDYFESVVADDSVTLPPATTTSDTFYLDDTFAIDPNKHTIPDEMGVGDTGVANRAEASDTLLADDAFAIAPNLTTITEILYADDVPTINPNLSTINEDITIDDLVATPRGEANEDVDVSDPINVEPVGKNSHRWEETSDPDVETEWNFFEWTEILDFTTSAGDTAYVDDAATVPAKAADTTDSSLSDDSVEVRFNVSSITDTAFADDAATVPPKDATTSDTGGSSDAVTNISSTLVAWDTNDWGAFNWTPQHN